jgi:hypothetical protein
MLKEFRFVKFSITKKVVQYEISVFPVLCFRKVGSRYENPARAKSELKFDYYFGVILCVILNVLRPY